MGLTGFGLGLIIFHGVSPKDSLIANCNKITEGEHYEKVVNHLAVTKWLTKTTVHWRQI